MTRFRRLLRAERRKVTSSAMLPGIAAVAAAFSLLNVVVSIAIAGSERAEQANLRLDDPEHVRSILTMATGASLFAVALGVLMMTSEYRHGTITGAFLGEPRRGPVMLAKLVAALGLGVLLAAVIEAVVLAVALPWITAKGYDTRIGDASTVRALAGTVVATGLWCTFGVAVGALLRNQIGALLTALGWLLVGESVVLIALPDVGKFLPSGAAAAVAGQTGAHYLGWWVAAAVMVGYVAVFSAAAAAYTLRRDIT